MPFPGEVLGSLHPSGVGKAMRSRRVWQEMLERVGVADTTVLTDEVVAAWRDLALGDNDGASYPAIMRRVREGHTPGAWASVVDSRTAAYPIRIAWGGHDPMLSLRKFGWKMLDATGLPSMTIVPGKHFLQEDNAPAVATVIAENAATGR